ncbi:MAG: tRNA (5-methylaminomethyl-2-thiouridine)(34)-methyltransferase MnmD [Saprospiraceae bacterium]|nr:tRNA (5-methylaminomethyl-2-thiouridine)(34)-methyltransferase MnmD [Saprospiraceae bacterium]
MIEPTSDGSNTIRSVQFGELYHSHHGALQESRHVFIEGGLVFKGQSPKNIIRILEYGFGTGLNAALSWQWSEAYRRKIQYVSLEAYPIDQSTADDLQYDDLLQMDSTRLHQVTWEEPHTISSFFVFTKHQVLFEDYKSDGAFDLVFYDAFAPAAQPHLWERPHLDAVVDSLVVGGMLLTYCAKGTFKRALKALGMSLESLPGPAGKREITRATKLQSATT